MNAPALLVPQVEVLRQCSVQEARNLGISRAKCWDAAMELIRLCGKLDDDELSNLLGIVTERLEFRDQRAYQACIDAGNAIYAIPPTRSEESEADSWYDDMRDAR